jgi:hypothetical protein
MFKTGQWLQPHFTNMKLFYNSYATYTQSFSQLMYSTTYIAQSAEKV